MATAPVPYPVLLNRYLKKHKRLVPPNQGMASLHPSLHLAYSMGRRRGFTDLGTYVTTAGTTCNAWRQRSTWVGVTGSTFSAGTT
jgi:hypothetical protein